VPSEFDLIGRYFARQAPSGMLGVGDDCALFPVAPGKQVATSMDLLLEGRHFLPDADPRALGHKALAVNLSDLAAMGAQPIGCLLGLALPRADESWLAAFASGFLELARAHECPLLGGDTTRSQAGLAISVTVFGAVDPARALRRDAAQPGDDVWVSGPLGAAHAALQLVLGRWPADGRRLESLRPALDEPQPRVAFGLALAGVAHAAIDLSDGLLQDLGHVLAASGCGACLREADIPVDPRLDGLPADRVREALLGGGDVYELCFTAAAGQREAVLQAGRRCGLVPVRIGEITASPGLRVVDAQGRDLPDLPRGFDHFGPAA
jgi:thiamine-monophosphate kinase